MLAVGAENFDNGEFLSDPRYVRWVMALWEKKDAKWNINWYEMHKCSDEEISKFKPAKDKPTAEKVKRLQDGKHLYCQDWKELEFELYGTETAGVDYTALDVMIVPCASKITLYDGSVVGGDEDCAWEKEDVQSYLGAAFNMLMYHNQNEF